MRSIQEFAETLFTEKLEADDADDLNGFADELGNLWDDGSTRRLQGILRDMLEESEMIKNEILLNIIVFEVDYELLREAIQDCLRSLEDDRKGE